MSATTYSLVRHYGLLLIILTSTSAFSGLQLSSRTVFERSHRDALRASTLTEAEPVSTVNGSNEAPTVYDCNEDAECVAVPACDEETCRTSLDVRIHNQWYDLSGWRKAHPAGEHWIDYYDGRDATEVMDAFHSEKGRAMYQRLPASSPSTIAQLESSVPADTSTQLAFRKLRAQLEADGWWERDMVHEATQLGIWVSIVVVAASCAHSLPLLSTSLLAVAMTSAGWLGHDYVHGVDEFAMKMRNFVTFSGGLGALWWSDKHNKVRVW